MAAMLICKTPKSVIASSLVLITRLILVVSLIYGLPVLANDDRVGLEIEVDREVVALGGEAGIEFLATVRDGWHINAHKPDEEFLVPTEIHLNLS